MMYDLPTSVAVGGEEYAIRSDFRAVLDICAALSDPELTDNDRGEAVLNIFYPDFEKIPSLDYGEAIRKCFWFINCGENENDQQKTPKLVDWEQDFPQIVAPINRAISCEIRALEYLHWWTFIAAYREIGDCTFAQIVRIRNQKAKGKPLDRIDREWYSQHRHLVDFKTRYTEAEDALLKHWGGG